MVFLAAFLRARTGSSDLSAYGGITKHAPALGVALFIVGLASIGISGTIGFPGEFLSLMGAFRANVAFAALGLLGVILSAAYFFRYYQRAFSGPAKRTTVTALPDLRSRELLVAVSLTAVVLLFGFLPGPL